jgi:hypothetical protein
MQVFHTAGVPPRWGRIIFPTIGCTSNKRVALTNSVKAKNGSKRNLPGETVHYLTLYEGGGIEKGREARLTDDPRSAPVVQDNELIQAT